jgi:hypothetical protein
LSRFNLLGHVSVETTEYLRCKQRLSQDRDDLDYGASADQPDIDKTGCGYRDLTPVQPASDLIRAQREADLGQRDWVFDDPHRVASDALARFVKTEESSIAGLKETRKAQGRIVYHMEGEQTI